MKSLPFDKRMESLKRRKRIFDNEIELLELKREDELRGRDRAPEPQKLHFA